MNLFKNGNRGRVFAGVLAAVVSLSACMIWAQEPATTPDVKPAVTAPAAEIAPTAKSLAAAGVKLAMDGKLEQGLDLLAKAAALDPADKSIAAAVESLKAYEVIAGKGEAQRKKEYQTAVDQVARCMFALKCQPERAKGDLGKKLRVAILGGSSGDSAATKPASTATATAPAGKDVISLFNRAGTGESLMGASDQESADKIQKNSIASIDDALTSLKDAGALLDGNSTEYATTFRKIDQNVQKQLAAYRDAWKSVKTDTAKARSASGKDLKKLEDDLSDSLIELESLVTEKPCLVALSQARQALNLTLRKDRDSVIKEAWYTDLVARAEEIGKDDQKKADWSDMLSIYASLADLAPDSETYKEMTRISQRHVRVMRLYGGKAASQPATPDEPEPSWREMTAGVDAEMVRSAISELDKSYVTAPDYRKLAYGALTAIKVLAQTPQAQNAFPNMADADKRADFVGEIDVMINSSQKRERMDDANLILTLNTLLKNSDKTVKIPAEVISMEFADGMLEELDRFSAMMWPSELQDFIKQTMGQFYGVGIQIGKEAREPLKVVAPLKDSPAHKAGIKGGDLILAVDGLRTEGMTVDALVKRITGPKDTQVVLQIKRPGEQPKDVTLVRKEIHVETVKGWQQNNAGDWDCMIDPVNKIGYIRLIQFTDQTTKELEASLDGLKKQGVKSLVLDLRFNPGGLLREAATVADEFLNSKAAPASTKGRIVYTSGRQSDNQEWKATAGGNFLDGDLVVLVNQYSASAAEIVSGALKDWGRAVVVGQRSYGKGSVQNVIPLAHGKARLKATTAYYYLPNGRCLHRKNGDKEWGVEPDVDVMVTPRQTRHWLDIRRKTDLLQDFDPDELSKDLSEQYQNDMQLNTAVMMLRLMQLQKDLNAA